MAMSKRNSNPNQPNKKAQSANFTCPKGHTKGIHASYRCHVWMPVDLSTGKMDAENSYGKEEFDEESWESNNCYWCPTCGDTFEELVAKEARK